MSVFQYLFKLSMLLSLLPISIIPIASQSSTWDTPPLCRELECPSYDLIESGPDYEIRLYNSTFLVSTPPIRSYSFHKSIETGVSELLHYFHGWNDAAQFIEMTAPTITNISMGDFDDFKGGWLSVVSLNLPKKNQENPPTAKDVNVRKWGPTYVAVRRFDAFNSDAGAIFAVRALSKSLLIYSSWRTLAPFTSLEFTVAQYYTVSSPRQFQTVNEVWLVVYDSNEELGAM